MLAYLRDLPTPAKILLVAAKLIASLAHFGGFATLNIVEL
jgi:hypothetical protein